MATVLRSAFPPWERASRPSGLWLPVLVALGYYAGCLAGFGLRFPSSGISFFWPPNAVLTAALVVAGRRSWSGILAASFAAHAVAHAQNGVPIAAWPIQFLGNGTQAVLAAFVLLRYPTDEPLFANLRKVLTFILGACLLAPAAASLIPANSYLKQGWAPDFSDAWLARFVSNGVATITLVPPLIMLWQFVRDRSSVEPRRLAEFGVIVLSLIGTHVLVGAVARADLLGFSVALYATVPLLLWATMRFGGAGLSFCLLWTSLLVTSMTLAGRGPLAGGPPAHTILGVQLAIMAMAIPMMLFAGLLEENHAEHAALLSAEQQNGAILRAYPDLMFVQSADGVYLQFYAKDPAALLVRPESFLGRNMDSVLPPDLAARFRSAFSSLTRDEPAIVEYTMDMEGAPRRYEARLVAVAGDRVLSVVRDITDRWRAETALHESARALKEANDAVLRMGRISAMAELSASIAHELDQPLTAIAANATAGLRKMHSAPPPDLRDVLLDIERDVHRARHIVARTHEMFANRPMTRQAVNVNDLIRDVLELADVRLREVGVALELKLEEQLPPVLADAVQVQQVLLNLVLNGVDAMQGAAAGSPRVLRITSRRSTRHFVVVSVRDSGGLAPVDVSRVFEPFYTTKPTGTGMGLTISRSIIKSHGGALWAVANALGHGATFRLTLPVYVEQAHDETAKSFAKRVLVVDDHEGVRTAISRLIETWGHTVEVAADGATALAQVESFRPDVVLLDISLHGMNGIDLARRLRQTSGARPYLIAFTASREASMRETCLAAGFDAYLPKGGDATDELERLLAS